MPDKKISELQSAASLALTDIFALVKQGSTETESGSFNQLLTLFAANGSLQLELFVGAGAPGAGTGKKFDIYLRTNGDVYQKTGAGWVKKGTLLLSGSGQKVYFISADPDNLVGVDNDIAFRNTGEIYQKDGGAWTLRGTLKTFPDLTITNTLVFPFGSNSIRFKIDSNNNILRLNYGVTADPVNIATDIFRFDIGNSLLKMLWGLEISSLKFTALPAVGDMTTDQVVVITPGGLIKRISPTTAGYGRILATKTEADFEVDGAGQNYVKLLDDNGDAFPDHLQYYLTVTYDDGSPDTVTDGLLTIEATGYIMNRVNWDSPRIYNLPASFTLNIIAK